MSSSIGFVCGEQDDRDLLEHARSIGLYIIAGEIGHTVNPDASKWPGCYLSLVPEDELHPYGDPPVKIADVIDPMLFLLRSYYQEPYLVFGHIQWNNDNKALGTQTKPAYQKLCRWIKSEWRKWEDTYVGPQAQIHLDAGAEVVPVLPGTATFTTIEV